jgi:hypothetical protein
VEWPVFKRFRDDVIWLVWQNTKLKFITHIPTVQIIAEERNTSQSMKLNHSRKTIEISSV